MRLLFAIVALAVCYPVFCGHFPKNYVKVKQAQATLQKMTTKSPASTTRRSTTTTPGVRVRNFAPANTPEDACAAPRYELWICHIYGIRGTSGTTAAPSTTGTTTPAPEPPQNMTLRVDTKTCDAENITYSNGTIEFAVSAEPVAFIFAFGPNTTAKFWKTTVTGTNAQGQTTFARLKFPGAPLQFVHVELTRTNHIAKCFLPIGSRDILTPY